MASVYDVKTKKKFDNFEKFTQYIMYIGEKYGRKEFKTSPADFLRGGSRRGEQHFRRGRWNDCGAVVAKNRHVGKERARHGNLGDFTRIVGVLFAVRMAGILQPCGVDSYLYWGNGRRFFRGAIVGENAYENGQFGLCGFTGGRGGVFTGMSFYLYLVLGFLGGIPAGMGMGGGTVTIPLLVLVGGVEQKIAQCANLCAFLPMSLGALKTHAENGLLRTEGVGWIVAPAVVLSALGAWAAGVLPAGILRAGFGVFLIVLAVVGGYRTLQND